MADIKINRKEPIKPPIESVDIIGLTYLEAQALLEVCYRVGGSPFGPRELFDTEGKHKTGLLQMLEAAGIVRPKSIESKGTLFLEWIK